MSSNTSVPRLNDLITQRNGLMNRLSDVEQMICHESYRNKRFEELNKALTIVNNEISKLENIIYTNKED